MHKIYNWSKMIPEMQQTRAGQASDFALRSFALSGSSCRWCVLQSGFKGFKSGRGGFGCYRVECMEVVDLDQLLSKHHSSSRVSNGVKRWGPGGKTNHVGNNHQHNAGHSRLGRQTNLIKSVRDAFIKKLRDYLGIFPNIGGGVSSFPKLLLS